MPNLTLASVAKSYDGTPAISDISLSLGAGKVLAVCGENGAGKSTLMKVLSGAILPDHGTIEIDGKPAEIAVPADAMRYGIRTVYQENSLLPHLSVAENMLMGRLPMRGGGLVIDWPAANERAAAVLAELGFPAIPPTALVRDIAVAQQQIVEIAKALVTEPAILILDEPTAVLSGSETETLFTYVRQLASRGVSILYISHRLEEIFRIADEVVVLKDGISVLQGPIGDMDEARLIEAMVGRPLKAIFPKRTPKFGEVVLAVEKLGDGQRFSDIDLSVRTGEIVGMFGLVGAGRTEVAKAIFGAEPVTTGKLVLKGREGLLDSPEAAIRAGMAMITEDRKGDGLALDVSMLDNMSLAAWPRLSRLGVVDGNKRHALAGDKIDELTIRPPQMERHVRQFSGGNQQKVVIAKWLLVEGTDFFIFDEPTRGVDVATKVEIYQMISDLAEAGTAILLISSELPEVIGLSDRILVMREGRIVAELGHDDFQPETVFAYAAGLAGTAQKETLH